MFFRFAAKICGDNETAKELTAKAFYYLLLYSHKLESPSHAEAILNTIIRHKWYDELKFSRGKEKLEWEEDLHLIIEPKYPDYFPATKIVNGLMQSLPPHYISVLKAYYYDELGRREIAKIFNIRLSEVDGIRHRAIAYLKEPEKIKFFLTVEMKKKQIDQFMELHEAGLKPRHIAKHFGIPVDIVKHGISNRLKKKRELQKQ